MNTEVIVEVLKLPRSYKLGIWLAVSLIIACGICFSILDSDWRWLGRFGALVVIAALVLEATGLVPRLVTRATRIATDSMPEVVEKQIMRQPHLHGLSGGETPEQLKEVGQKELKRRAGEAAAFVEKAMTRDLRKLEFWVASIGTVLWAFAELLNSL